MARDSLAGAQTPLQEERIEPHACRGEAGPSCPLPSLRPERVAAQATLPNTEGGLRGLSIANLPSYTFFLSSHVVVAGVATHCVRALELLVFVHLEISLIKTTA